MHLSLAWVRQQDLHWMTNTEALQNLCTLHSYTNSFTRKMEKDTIQTVWKLKQYLLLLLLKFIFTKWGTSLQMEMFTMPGGDFPLFIRCVHPL